MESVLKLVGELTEHGDEVWVFVVDNSDQGPTGESYHGISNPQTGRVSVIKSELVGKRVEFDGNAIHCEFVSRFGE